MFTPTMLDTSPRRGNKPSIIPMSNLVHYDTNKKTASPMLQSPQPHKINEIELTMNRKRREVGNERRSVIVVLEGTKVSSPDHQEAALAPLKRAVRGCFDPHDEILVLTLLRRIEADHDCSDHQYLSLYEEDPYLKVLQREISSRRFVYRKIFKPFYESCKAKGVNFEVKIAAGYRPKDIIVEEANKAKATWIVMDSCFTRDLSFRISGTSCNVSLVDDNDEGELMFHNSSHQNDGLEDSVIIEGQGSPKSPRLSADEEFSDCSSQTLPFLEPCSDANMEQVAENDTICAKADTFELPLPLQLSWEAILKITRRFSSRICTSRDAKCSVYKAYLDERSLVLVKRFADDSSDILEAEMRAALMMNHRNILGLVGYSEHHNATVLVFPCAERGSLATYLCGLRENMEAEWRFEDKIGIALGVAQGLRYMHEECPGGPIVHGDLVPCNIFIRRDFCPLISGFEKAKRIHLESTVGLGIASGRSILDPFDEEAIKSDVLSFGVLLLRLFCRKSIPQDDRMLIEWARPFLVERAFHELQDDDSDVHGIYKVMSAATQCTKANPNSRPSMTEVISILRGQRLCDMPCEIYTCP